MMYNNKMTSFDILNQNNLSLSLVPISLRELFYLTETPCEVYGLEDGLFRIILKRHTFVNKNVIKDLIEKKQIRLFIKEREKIALKEGQQEQLRSVTRSLSIGDSLEKAKKLLNLLTINMSYLYEDTTDDDTLNLQYQAVKNLSSYLMEHSGHNEELIRHYIKQKHHFIFAQPLLSSLFLLGFLKHAKIYNNREIQNLFYTSYFKDIGMSAIPTEKYDQKELSPEEKEIFNRHPQNSVTILEGRLPFNRNHLKIIENHHAYSLLKKDLYPDVDQTIDLLEGFETMIVSVTDIISAMTTPRPFREAENLFDSLEYIKNLIYEQYPQEFRVMVGYFKKHFLQRD